MYIYIHVTTFVEIFPLIMRSLVKISKFLSYLKLDSHLGMRLVHHEISEMPKIRNYSKLTPEPRNIPT